MLAHEVRSKYIEFFQSRGHLHQSGSPLSPVDALGNPDNSTLFTSAGMQQFKPYFTGAAIPPKSRIVTVQKCLRTNDIDSVGDFSHCTFFEMLGNFSFGDYFKSEVIPWTWEFLTKVVGLDPDRFCVTVFVDDTEAYSVWHDEIGLSDDRIHRLGADKNFWPANAIEDGPNGPCGPCSEVFYRMAPIDEMTTDPSLTPTERYLIDDKAGRWLEVWNNVFTQFDRGEDANNNPVLTPLPKKNNDTGAGLDRIAFASQGKTSVFETDLFGPTLDLISQISGRSYKGSMSSTDFAFRVVAEHTRSSVFCIADGILPSNEGRGYVLRYILRRAIRYGKSVLGFDQPFLHSIAPKIVEQMGDFYPELVERRDLILRTLHDEEERFRRTLDNGIIRLEEMLANPAVQTTKILPGRDVFTLYDTYGFPLRLTEEISQERGFQIDMSGFEQALEAARQRSQAASAIDTDVFSGEASGLAELQRSLDPTKFVGYDSVLSEAHVVGLLAANRVVESAMPGEDVVVVLDRTPFYAESGGQVGDTGDLTSEPGNTTCALSAKVTDTRKNGGLFLHTAKVLKGDIRVGMAVGAAVNSGRRRDIMRNHTATHLLQASLRHVLGQHVHQKGSRVGPDRLRFDYTHSQPLTPFQIKEIEDLVNRNVLEDSRVTIYADLPIAEAKARGAMALFGEKYGDRVRMVEVPGFSLELCGGTHISHTSQIALLKIISETGVAAGVRRIEAVTGAAAFEYVNRREETLKQAADLLKAAPTSLVAAIQKVLDERRELDLQNRKLKAEGGSTSVAELQSQTVAGVTFVAHRLENADPEAVSNLADSTAQRLASAVVVIGSANGGKVTFAAKVTADLVGRGIHAGNLVREVAKITGGGGGGRPDFAQAGGKDEGKIDEALGAVAHLIEAAVSQKTKG